MASISFEYSEDKLILCYTPAEMCITAVTAVINLVRTLSCER